MSHLASSLFDPRLMRRQSRAANEVESMLEYYRNNGQARQELETRVGTYRVFVCACGCACVWVFACVCACVVVLAHVMTWDEALSRHIHGRHMSWIKPLTPTLNGICYNESIWEGGMFYPCHVFSCNSHSSTWS